MESSCEEIIRLANKVLDGGEITREEAGRLIRTKDEDTMLLLAMADKIRQKYNGNAVDFCAIINARSGHCQEDCKFCAQSGHYRTGATTYRLLPEDQILAAAKKAKDAGAVRFSLVTSGRNQDNPNEFEEIFAKQASQESTATSKHHRRISRKSAPRTRWKIRKTSSRQRRRQASAYARAASSDWAKTSTSVWKWHSI